MSSACSSQDPIAIIGSACRFPGGADSASKLWDLIREPRDVLQEIPQRLWNAEAFFHKDPEHHGTFNVRSSYLIDNDPADLDHNFFNIQPAEAEAIDPQQRMLMEVVYESLCASGQSIETLRGSSTAIIVGAMTDDWSYALDKDWETLSKYSATGKGRSIMANRVSYFFDWHGASITIDTACSSSLVAVHLGIQAIRSGESRVAVAAGTNLILTPSSYLSESNLHMLSSSGRCKMWDRGADGYGRGEGVAAIIMKPLSAALEDKDDIKCIIRGTGINQDGRTSRMTVLSSLAQASLIRDTYARAGLDIDKAEDRPQLFHAHGTGTPAGDPREAEAISRAFRSRGEAKDKLYVGSIKTVFGHTEGTAGLASLIGSMLAVQHGVIPPNMHFNNLSPQVAPFYDGLEVPTVAKPWPELSPGEPRRASVNSFGFGGTNAHAIIESYEPESVQRPSSGPSFSPVTVSAASEKSLRELLALYSSYIKANPKVSLRDFAYTLQERRSTLAYRIAIPASTTEEVVQRIDTILRDGDGAEASALRTRHFPVASPRLLGVFTGQGAQWPRMGARLVELSPFAARRLEEFDAVLASLPAEHRPGWTMGKELLANASSSRVHEATISQPLCTAVQVLIVDLLNAAGIKLHAVVGHSSGEIAAAYASGLISDREAIVIAYYRGYFTRLAESPRGVKGAMLAVGTTFNDAASFCEVGTFRNRVQIAAHNSSSSITLTGDEDAIDQAQEKFKSEGKFTRKLRVDTAYHSFHMVPCAGPYIASIEAFDRARGTRLSNKNESPNLPLWYSSVHQGRRMTSGDVSTKYWADNLTRPVLFAPALAEAVRDGSFDLAIEIGPHPALKGPCLATLEEASGDQMPYSGTLCRGKDDVIELSRALGVTWSSLGPSSVKFEAFEELISGQPHGRNLIKSPDLPDYPWDHARKFWQLSRVSSMHMNQREGPNPLLGRRCVDRETSDKIQWRNLLKPKEIGWLQGHQLQGQIVFPATGYISMAVEAVSGAAGHSDLSLIHVEDLVIERGIAFTDENSTIESLFILDIVQRTDNYVKCKFSLYCGDPYDGSRPFTLHGSGGVWAALGQAQPDTLPLSRMIEPEDFNMLSVDADRFYGQFEPVRYQYSPPFRGIESIRRKDGFASGTLVDQVGVAWADRLLIHPAMLDCALQSGLAAWCCPGDGRLRSLYAPTRIGSVAINPYYASRDPSARNGTVLPWETAVEHRAGHLSQDTIILSPDNAHTYVQVQGLDTSPLAQPGPDEDLPLFSEFRYCVDRPDGAFAAIDDAPLRAGEDGLEAERLALYYLRRLGETISAEEKRSTLPHFQYVLNWASHVVQQVRNGNHPTLKPSYLNDTEDRFESFFAEYGHRVQIRLMRSVGEHLPEVIRSRSSILEHMTKDGMLESVYAEGLGLEQANRYMAKMIAHIGHRYPRMRLLEIDISSGFFEAAKERFEPYESRMIYKTYNMELSPAVQGFIGGSYDVVISSHALHATDKLEEMMAGIRSLLKPGGYLIIQELISNDVLRINLPMCGLPGWWAGAEKGRPWGPALSPLQWDALLRQTGFSGIDSKSVTGTVFASQAVDERIQLLRSPLSSMAALPPPATSHLMIVGGETALIQQTTLEIERLLAPRYRKVTRLKSFGALKCQDDVTHSTVVVVSELDEPLMAHMTPEKHESLQLLWRKARTVLWVSQGARADNPYSYMTVGLGRCVHHEYPNITLQRLDLDSIAQNTPQLLAEELLRLESLTSWGKEIHRKDILWSIEPEVYIESGVRQIPRLYRCDGANERYNSESRTITRQTDPGKDTLLLTSRGHATPYQVQCASPLRLPPLAPFAKATRTIRISQFMLQTIEIASASRLRICVGLDEHTAERVIALSHATESPVPVAAEWVLPLPRDANPFEVLANFSAYATASNMLKTVPQGGTLLVHEPDPIVALMLQKLGRERDIRLAITTSVKAKAATGWQYIHERLPRRHVKQTLPAAPSVFFDMSPTFASFGAIGWIQQCIPERCATYKLQDLFGSNIDLAETPSTQEIAEVFKATWNAINDQDPTPGGQKITVIPLNEISDHNAAQEHLAVVDCSSSPVTATVESIDTGTLFRQDKTYILFGLANDIGQSLCGWMVRHGAGHVVMTSRHPKVHDKFLQSLSEFPSIIKVLPCDITSRDSLHQCYEEIRQTLPPVAGIVNGAMILRDNLFENMSFEDFKTVLDPKVKGTRLLDELFYDTPLDFFVVTSSLTAIIGNSGQSNYTSANMFMVALMAQRKKRGLAGSAMGMSSLLGLGFIERSKELDGDYFTKLGCKNISETDLRLQFAEAILIGRPEHDNIYAEIGSGLVPTYADDTRIKARWRSDIRFSHLVLERTHAAPSGSGDLPIRTKLAGARGFAEASNLVKDAFMARLRRIMMIAEEEPVDEKAPLAEQGMDEKAPLAEQGMDSLIAVEIRTWFLKELEVDVPVLRIVGGGSILDLLAFALQNIPKSVVDLAALEADSNTKPATVSVSGKTLSADRRLE
ncbi:hypothetical protein F4778DRAFT_786418 [Xylariomycetidae sp. FL2044]|nr:hypothetical protein F4778DRAFT_786418 [Xylariomycetidae sp. FL2044]